MKRVPVLCKAGVGFLISTSGVKENCVIKAVLGVGTEQLLSIL